MHNLWSRWPEVEKHIRSRKNLLFLLDYDGTLTLIAPTPRQARLSPQTKLVLRRLSRRPNVTLAVISGRALADLKRKVGLRSLAYAGNHGLELWWDNRRRTVKIPRTLKKALSEVARMLTKVKRDFDGVIMENKGLSLSFHYRLVEASDLTDLKKEFWKCVMPFVQSGKVRVVNGKRVFEVRPNVPWTKGHAALWFTKKLGNQPCLPIYIGDDQTDEDAFRMLRSGITIRVGEHDGSWAKYYVRRVAAVVRFLESIADEHGRHDH
jgi:trehalose 6-phosphate phosphatase